MTGKLKACRSLIGQYGVGGCAFRVWLDFRRKTGLLRRRFPLWAWPQRPLETWLSPQAEGAAADYRRFRARGAAKFFFPPSCPPKLDPSAVPNALHEADRLLEGQFLYFSHAWGKLGYPQPDWFGNPFTGRRAHAGLHWCDAGDFLQDQGDIKFYWEPSRFGWVYALARAYAATADEKYPRAFWTLVESWMQANPPNTAPNWKCGQETAIRLMACCFGLHAFWASPASTEPRVRAMGVLLAASAERIERHIEAARQQRSNHAATEAAGLYTAGLLLPEMTHAARWRKKGKSVLEEEARRHNWIDGSYVQHSMNYQRMALQDYLWCLRLAELNGESLADDVRERLGRSCRFLYHMQDETTGRCPNYGANDGALVLPLSECPYRDYRPLIGAMHYLFTGKRLYGRGPWEEDLLWLFGRQALDAPIDNPPHASTDFTFGGYFTLRGRRAWAMTRCHSYVNRPSQADMLHLDLWWRGVNVLRDSGTFSYYDPQDRWNEYFLSTAAHNTLVLAGESQMTKGPRFMWFDLTRSRFLGRWRNNGLEVMTGEHHGYRRLPSRAIHRRAVCLLGDDCWLVLDEVLGTGDEQVQLFWHLADAPCRLAGNVVTLQTEQGPVQLTLAASAPDARIRLDRGLDGAERMGWQSLHYGQRTPAPSVCLSCKPALPARFLTLLCLGSGATVTQCDLADSVAWTLAGQDAPCRVDLQPPGREQIVRGLHRGEEHLTL